MTLAIIGGTGLLHPDIFPGSAKKKVATRFGSVQVNAYNSCFFLQRHGHNLPPHLINHKANLTALKHLGVDEIIAFSSVGSLRRGIKPGDLVIIDDFIQLSNIPTFIEKDMRFVVPCIDKTLRTRLIKACATLRLHFKSTGIYLQTIGPRFETKSEIAMYKRFAHVVGMTIASEATLANELGIPYACVCSVDNYANGLVRSPLDWQSVKETQARNLISIKKLLRVLIK
ncbi:MAG: MTAP family purine nucleoside phosphorylase [Candidatus Woesearchaeota archaeon]